MPLPKPKKSGDGPKPLAKTATDQNLAELPQEVLDNPEISSEVKAFLSLQMSAYTSHSGPIPPAEVLASYREVTPDLPEKIVGWADMQIRHRLALETSTTHRAERRMDRAQLLAFAVAIFGIAIAAVVALKGGSWIVATAIATVAVGGPSAATILAAHLGRTPPPDAVQSTPKKPPRSRSRGVRTNQ